MPSLSFEPSLASFNTARAMAPRSLRTIIILVATAFAVFLVSTYSRRHLPVESIQQHLPAFTRLQVPQQMQWGAHETDDARETSVPPPSSGRYNLSEIWFPQVEKTVEDRLWVPKNNRAMRELLACMQQGACRANQVRVRATSKAVTKCRACRIRVPLSIQRQKLVVN